MHTGFLVAQLDYDFEELLDEPHVGQDLLSARPPIAVAFHLYFEKHEVFTFVAKH